VQRVQRDARNTVHTLASPVPIEKLPVSGFSAISRSLIKLIKVEA
jgi:hypothetical protein